MALGPLLLQIQRLCIWKPNIQHVAAESGFVDKANCAMAFQCLYLSTPKGQTVAFTLCTKAASAYAVLFFNIFLFVLGNLSYDYYVF